MLAPPACATAARASSSRPRSIGVDNEATACAPCCGTRRAGTSGVVRARYLVAADGAHSTVRARSGHPDARPRSPRRGRHRAVPGAALGRASAITATASTASSRPEAMGLFLPAGRGRPLALRRATGIPRSSRRPTSTRSGCSQLIRLGAGVPELEPQIERIGAFSFAAQTRRRLPPGEHVPDRRCRAPRHAARRHRHELRDPRRLRPRLEARLGAARLGRRRRCSTPTSASAGRSSSTTSRARPTRTARTGTSGASCTSTSASASRTSGCRSRAAASRRST